MKTTISLVVPLLLLSSVTLSQQSADSVEYNSKAIYFYLINQVALSYQSQISQDFSWTISADVSGSKSNETQERDRSNIAKRDIKSESFALSVIPQALWHFDVSPGRVRLLTGAGPEVRYVRDYTNSDQTDIYNTPNHSFYTQTVKTWEMGIVLTCGIEVRVTRTLSLGAKYDLAGTYSVGTQTFENTYTAVEETKIKQWKLELSQIRIGLGVNF